MKKIKNKNIFNYYYLINRLFIILNKHDKIELYINNNILNIKVNYLKLIISKFLRILLNFIFNG